MYNVCCKQTYYRQLREECSGREAVSSVRTLGGRASRPRYCNSWGSGLFLSFHL